MEDELIHDLCAAYALDALAPDEERAFEAHLASCARCREELAGLSETAAALAYAVPPAEPPARLRARILDAARAERPNVVPLRPRRSAGNIVLASVAAAAACAAVGLGIWAATLHGRLGSNNQALSALALHGASGSLVRAQNGEAALVVSGLSPAPPGKTYETWVIRSGKATRAGLFSGKSGTAIVQLTRRVPSGAIVGVTLERAGGVEQPTSTPLVTSAPAA